MDNELLAFIDKLVAFLTLAIVLTNLLVLKNVTSVTLAATAFLVVQAISIVMTPFIVGDVSQMSKELARVLFYIPYAFVDLVAVLFISRVHSQFRLKIDGVTNFVVRCLQFMAVLQVVRYIDREFAWDLLGLFYRHAIPTANLAIAMVITYATIKLVIRSNGMSGLKGV